MERIASLVKLTITEQIVDYVIRFVLTIHKLCHFLKHHALECVLLGVSGNHLLQLLYELILID